MPTLLDGQHAANFTTNGHLHSAVDVTSGTLTDARLSSNVATLTGAQTFTGAKTFAASANFSTQPSFSAGSSAPFTVSSSLLVTGLNADQHDGYHAGNATNNIPVNNGTVNTGLNADMVDGVHGGNIPQVHASGVVANGQTVTLTIPHYTIFTLQLSSGWATGGIAVLQGFENDSKLGVTYTKYNGDGTSAAGGSTTDTTTANTVMQFGNSGVPTSYTVRCASDTFNVYPGHLELSATGVELLYRLVY